MNDNHLAMLAAWLRSKRAAQNVAYANSIGIDLDEQDCVTLFHYINDQRSNNDERTETAS